MMKRSPIKRKTALPRTGGTGRRGKIQAKRKTPRPSNIGEWIDGLDHPHTCWWCGGKITTFNWREIHHIERRSHCTPESENHPCNLFVACQACHSGPLATASHAAQLAKKRKWDASSFDLEAWLRTRDPELRAPERVTLAEIEAYEGKE